MTGMIIAILAMAILIFAIYKQSQKMPKCKWCDTNHYGRCVFNPRAGKIFSNHTDDFYDYYDPNK